MRKFIRDNKGFTMLELLMVIIVVGLLASLAIPQFASMAERARASEAVQTINAMKSAEAIYQQEKTNYADTTNLSGVVTFPTSGGNTYYTFTASPSTSVSYVLTATRTSKGGVTAGSTITYTYTSSSSSGAWGGTYTAVIPS